MKGILARRALETAVGGQFTLSAILEATIWLGHSLGCCVDADRALVDKRSLEVIGKETSDSPGGATQFILVAEPLAESCQGHPGGYLWCEV